MTASSNESTVDSTTDLKIHNTTNGNTKYIDPTLLTKKQKLQHNNTVVKSIQQYNGRIQFKSIYDEQTNTYQTIISDIYATYPLKLFPLATKNIHSTHYNIDIGTDTNDTTTIKPALCYMITYGGGILANDSIHALVTIDTNSTAILTTQTSTKVYKSLHTTQHCTQTLDVTIGTNSTLYLIPDPITPYKQSNYIQKQVFHLTDSTSNLLLIDSYTAGRYDDIQRNERWNFQQYCSINQIYIDNQSLVYDAVQLSDNSTTTVLQRMKQYNTVCMCSLVGTKLQSLYQYIYNTIQQQHINYDSRRNILTGINRNCIISVSPLYLQKQQQSTEFMNGIIVRIVAISTQLVNHELKWMFQSIEKELIAPPWIR